MKGCSSARKASPRGRSPAHGARLDEGRPLPVLADALVVFEGRRHRHRAAGSTTDRAAAAGPCGRRSRPAVRSCISSASRCVSRTANGLRLDARRPAAGRSGSKKTDDVDVAGVVQLERALLAHGDAEAAAGPAPRRPRRHASAGRRPPPPRAATRQAAATAASANRLARRSPASRSQTPPRSASAVSRCSSAFSRRSAPPAPRFDVPGHGGGAALQQAAAAAGRDRRQQGARSRAGRAAQARQIGRGGEHRRQRRPRRRRRPPAQDLARPLGRLGVDDRAAGLSASARIIGVLCQPQAPLARAPLADWAAPALLRAELVWYGRHGLREADSPRKGPSPLLVARIPSPDFLPVCADTGLTLEGRFS